MEIKEMTACTLGAHIRDKKISVTEAVRASLDEIKAQEPQVHAFLTCDEAAVMDRVKDVEDGIASGRYTGPLAGVPVAVKDNICVKGLPTTCASKILENFVPVYNAHVIDKMEAAGMIVIGKTNMDEFAMGSTSETSAFGVTRNPWNTGHVPGGSSGGSCAAVSSGEVAVALGSDTGGSIRQPAAFCGVTGLKPTYGRVSRYGLIAYASSLDQIGPIGRDTKDCAALLDVIAGHDVNDSTSVPGMAGDFLKNLLANEAKISAESKVSGTGKSGVSGMRFGIPKEYLSEGLDKQIEQALSDIVQLLTVAGAKVEFFSMDHVDDVIPAYYIIACAEASSNLERFDGVKYGYRSASASDLHDMYKKTRNEGFGDEVQRRILLGSFVLSSGYYDAYYLKALKVRRLIKNQFDEAFKKYDVIIAPAAPTTAPKIGESLSDPLKMYLSDIYTAGVNLAGIPGITVPFVLSSEGLPIGFQLLGDCFQEPKILQAAYTLEKLWGRQLFPWERSVG